MSLGYKRTRIVGVIITLIVIIMVTSSISSAFYGAGGTSNSSSSHIYIVTETMGGQKYSYYEQVRNGSVVKTWPAPSAPSSSGTVLTSNVSLISPSLNGANDNSKVTVSPSFSSLEIGQYQVFTASSKSQNWDYYQWQLGDSSGPTGNILGQDQSFTFTTSNTGATVNTPGTYYLWVTVGMQNAQQSASAYAEVNVSPAIPTLSVEITSPLSITIDAGQSFTATGTISGGTGSGYGFAWVETESQGPSFPASFNSTSGSISTSISFSNDGNYNVYLFGVEGNGAVFQSSSYIQVSVLSPIIPSIVAPNNVDIKGQQSFTAQGSISGGSEEYLYAWIVAGDTPSISASSFEAGNTSQGQVSSTLSSSNVPALGIQGKYEIYLYAEDTNSPDGNVYIVGSSHYIKVKVSPISPALSVQITSSLPITVDAGQSFAVSGIISGGTGSGYEFAWVALTSQSPSNPASFNSTNGQITTQLSFSSSNTYYVFLFGEDSGGKLVQASGYIVVTVNPAISPSITSSLDVSVSSGQPFTVTGDISGGSGTYLYAWMIVQSPGSPLVSSDSFDDNNNSFGSVSASLLFAGAGTYYVYLFAEDSNSPDGNAYIVGTSGYITVTVSNAVPTISVQITSSLSVTVDAGQSFTATAKISGQEQYGSYHTYGYYSRDHHDNYGYAWVATKSQSPSNPTSFNSTNGRVHTQLSFSNSGTYYVYLFATSGQGGITEASNYIVVTVNLAISPTITSSSTVDVNTGQSFTAQGSISGGSGDYLYAWIETDHLNLQNGPRVSSDSFYNANTTSGSVSNSLSFARAGTYYVYLYAEDGNSPDGNAYIVGTSNYITVTVNYVSKASVFNISPGTATVGQGQTLTLTASLNSNFPNYLGYWYVSTTSPGYELNSYSALSSTAIVTTADGSSIMQGGSVSISFSSSSTWYLSSQGTYYLWISDSNGNPGGDLDSNVVTVTVTSLPIATISVSPSAFDSGQSTSVVLSISGGVTPYTWTLEVSGSDTNRTDAVLGPNGFTFGSSLAAGTYKLYFNVTDSNSQNAKASAIITVNSLPTVTILPSSVTIDQSQSVTFTNITKLGTPSYSYSYSVSPSTGWVRSVIKENTFVFTAKGTYTVTLTITDSAGITSSSSATVTVGPLPQATIYSEPSTAVVDVGQETSFTSLITGTGAITYQWYLNGTSIPGATSATYSFTPNTVSWNEASFYLIITDSTGATTQSNTIIVLVYPDPTVSISPTGPVYYDSGQSASALTASVNYGGENTISVEWFSNSQDSTTGGTDTGISGFHFTPSTSTSVTTYYYAVVSDSGVLSYSSSSNIVEVKVYEALSVSISATPTSVDTGQSTVISNTTNGGATGPMTYSWDISPASGWSQGTSTSTYNTFTFSLPGIYTLTLTVTDSLGSSASSTLRIKVGLAPEVSVEPTGPLTLDIGQSSFLTANVKYDGNNKASVTWYSSSSDSTSGGTPTGVTGTSFPIPTSASGTTYYFAVVSDSGISGYASYSNVVEVTVSSGLAISVAANSPTPTQSTVSNGTSLQELIVDSGQYVTFDFTGYGGTSVYYSGLYYSSSAVSSTSTLSSITALTPVVALSSDSSIVDVSNQLTGGYYYLVVEDVGTSPVAWVYSFVQVSISPPLGITATLPVSGSGNATSLSAAESTGQSVTFDFAGTGGFASGNLDTALVTPSYSVTSAQGAFTYAISNSLFTTGIYDSPVTVESGTYYLLVENTGPSQGTYNYVPAWVYVTVTITIIGDPTVSVTPSSAIYDIGQSASPITATVTYSGSSSHSSDYSNPSDAVYVEWYSSSSSDLSSPTPTGQYGTSFTPPTTSGSTGGTVTYYFAVVFDKDVSGASAYSQNYYTSASTGFVKITIYSLPSALITSPSPSSTDSGQLLSLVGTATGGYTATSGVYSYAWVMVSSQGTYSPSSYNTSTSGTITGSLTFTYTSGTYTTYYVYLYVEDSNNVVAVSSIPLTVSVYPALSVTVVAPSITSVDVGQSIQFSGSFSGGASSYKYIWSTSGTAPSPSDFSNSGATGTTGTAYYNDLTITSGITTYTDYMWVEDGNGNIQGNSAQVTVTISSTLSSIVGVSPSSFSLDAGQSISAGEFSGSWSGGASPYSYEWVVQTTSTPSYPSSGYSSTTGTSVSDSPTLTASGSGPYYVFLYVKDSGNQKAYGYSTITVNPALSSSSVVITVTPGIIENSQAASLSVLPTTTLTGTPTYTVQWLFSTTASTAGATGFTNLGSSTKDLNSAGVLALAQSTGDLSYATSASWYFELQITDSGNPAEVVYSNVVEVTVSNIAVSITSPSASSVSIDAAQTLTISGTFTGGTAPYLYKWVVQSTSASSVPNSGYTQGTSPQFYSYTPSSATHGTFYVYLYIKDSKGGIGYSYETVTVNAQLSVSLSPAASTIDAGQYVTFTNATNGGSGSYKYSYGVTLQNGGSAAGVYSVSSNTITFTASGSYYVTLSVLDSVSDKVTSQPVAVKVDSALSVVLSPLSASIDIGQSTTFSNNTASTGTPPYKYSWTVTLNGASASGKYTQSTNTFTFTSIGTYKVYLNITDSAKGHASSYSTVTVSSSPSGTLSILTVTISGPSVSESGQSVTLNINSVTGGTGPYAAQILAMSPGSSTYSTTGQPVTSFSSFPQAITTSVLSTSGVWNLEVEVYEVSNPTVYGFSSPIAVTVSNVLTASAITISPTATDVGTPVTATVASGYGTGPFTYSWTASPTTGWTYSGNQITFSAQGTYVATVTVSDAHGSAQASATITVASGPQVTLLPASSTIDVGQSIAFTNTSTGGVGPFRYSYSVTSSFGTSGSNSYTISGNTITFNVAGSYSVTLTETDSLSNTITSSPVQVRVHMLPVITISPASTSIDIGQSITYTNTTNYGTSPYTYTWSYPSGSGITQSGNKFTFADLGTFTIVLTVADSVGKVSSASSEVTVNSQPTGSLTSLTVTISGPSTSVNGLATNIYVNSVSGGSGPYKAQLLDIAPGLSSYVDMGSAVPFNSAPASFSTSPLTTVGTWYFEVEVSESNNPSVTGYSSSVTINVINFQVSISPLSTTIDTGGSVTFSNATTATPVSYSWSVTLNGTYTTSSQVYSQSGNTFTFLKQGKYVVYLNVTNAGGIPASAYSVVTVNSSPTGGLSSPARTPSESHNSASALNFQAIGFSTFSPDYTIDVGTPLTATGSGGAGPPYHFSWVVEYFNNTTVVTEATYTLSAYPSATIVFNVPGQYIVQLTTYDSTGTPSSSPTTADVQVYTQLISTLASGSSSGKTYTFDVGGGVTLTDTPTVSGGNGPYTYQWAVNGTNLTTSGSSGTVTSGQGIIYPFTPTGGGNYTVQLYIQDSSSIPTVLKYSTYVNVGKPLTSSNAVSIIPTSVGVGGLVGFSVKSGYGTPPYSSQWTIKKYPSWGSASGDYSISSSGNQVTFNTPGTYSVNDTVTDVNQTSTTAHAIVTVVSGLTTVISPSTSEVDVGKPVLFTNSTSGGTTPYTYSYSVTLQNGGSASGDYTVSGNDVTFSNAGSYDVTLTVKDSLSGTATSQPVLITVNNDPTPSALSLSSTSTETGVPLTLNVQSGFGTGPFVYQWNVNPSSGWTSTNNQITFSTPGSYSVGATVTDADLQSATMLPVTVNVAALSISVSISSSTTVTNGVTSTDVNHPVYLTGTVTPGGISYTYSWQLGGSEFSAGSSSAYTFPSSAVGNYTVWLNVSEGTVTSSSAHILIVVNPPPSAILPGSGTPEIDANYTFNGTVFGGTSPFSYSWTVTQYPSGLTAYGNYTSSGNSTYFYKPGKYKVVFKVTDFEGETNSTSAILLVNTALITSSSIGSVGSITSISIDRGNSTTVVLTVQGGSGLYAFQWYEELPGSSTWQLIVGETNSSYHLVTNSTTQPGIYYFRASITDVVTDPVVVYSNVVEVAVLYPIIYQVLFTESGLPLGTKWYIDLTDGQSFSSTLPTISFLIGNGTYGYSVNSSDSRYKLVSTSDSFVVNGYSITVKVVFSPEVYSVVFSEYGIGAGTEWYVNLTDGQSYSSSGSTISFFEPNGTYTYSVEASNHKYVAFGGSFLVNGSSTSISVIFVAIGYQVSFTETGLPHGTKWYINITGGKSYSSNNSTITIYEVNGTYSYSIATADKSYSSPKGTFVVDGASFSSKVSFTPVLYDITFQETGLPSGTLWNVTLNGTTRSGKGPFIFSMMNGSYSYNISSVSGYRTKDYSGNVIVAGSNVTVTNSWTQITYPVTITISGLPSGSSWSATIEGPSIAGQPSTQTLTSTSNVITFYEPNGSYSYSVDLPSGYHASIGSGTVSVNGKSATVIEQSSISVNELLIVSILVASLAVVSLVVAALLVKRKRDRDLFRIRNMER